MKAANIPPFNSFPSLALALAMTVVSAGLLLAAGCGLLFGNERLQLAWLAAGVVLLVLWAGVSWTAVKQANAARAREAFLRAAQLELMRARDEALQVSQAKSAFLAVLSHEIRTPLHGVLSLCRFLSQTPLNPTQAKYTDHILQASKVLNHIVDEVLDMSKIEAGMMRLDNQPFDLRKTLEQACDLMAPCAAAKGITLVLDLEPSLDTQVVGDSTRLLQIANNLIHNAIKFTQGGGVRVSVVADAADSTHRAFRIGVADSGIGIRPEDLERLFRPYEQADSATSQRYGGTGLGLPIAQSLVKAMGGELEVESTVGVGTTFSFTCRLAAPAIDACRPPAPPNLPSHRCRTPRSPFRRPKIGTFHSLNFRRPRIMNRSVCVFISLALTLLLGSPRSMAGEVEVLHFWTSPGEAKSIAELKALIAVRGHTWKDFVVVGGGGGNAMAALKQRTLAGNPPASASIKGPAIQEWAATNALANLDAMADFAHWDDVLPKVVQEHVKYKGHYVAVPVNIHRANWLWTNAEVLRKSGVDAAPVTFADFLAAADKIKAAGFIPLAHGGQPWQDFVLFESVALGVGGADFYKKAFVNLEPAALSGAEMRRSLEAFRRIKSYTDDKSRGRDWNVTTDLVIQGKAAFQVMGDWAKGEFIAAGRRPGKDFFCSPAPGAATTFSYVIDTFAMFQLKNWEAQKAQGYLAYVLLGSEFQKQFNLRKGSIPVRMDLRMDEFDECAKASRRDFDATAKSDALVPSVAIGMAPATSSQAALQAVVSEFWNNDALPVNDAITRLLQTSSAKPK